MLIWRIFKSNELQIESPDSMRYLNLKTKPLDMETGRKIVVLHEQDAEELGHFAGDRVKLTTPGATLIAIANSTKRMVQRGEIGTFIEVTEALVSSPEMFSPSHLPLTHNRLISSGKR